MESLTTQQGEPSLAVVSGWVLLPRFSYKATKNSSVVADDDNDMASSATCRTSTGRLFRVSFRLVPPPEISRLSYRWLDPQEDDFYPGQPKVVAAHGDCVLLEVLPPTTDYQWFHGTNRPRSSSKPEYLLYQAAAAAGSGGRPPLLLLLPPCYIAFPWEQIPCLLRRSEADDDIVLVSQLDMRRSPFVARDKAELCFLRLGRDGKWQRKTVPIVGYYDDGSNKGIKDNHEDNEDDGDNVERRLRSHCWCTDTAFAVGDRFMCWVDYLRGLLFVDMTADAEASLRLRYMALPLPAVPRCQKQYRYGSKNMAWTWNLAAAGAGSVRFVDVECRLCCRSGGSTRCEHGRSLFTVTTWTMNLSRDAPIEWVNDGALECDELWAQPGYKDLPRASVECPIVMNPDDPDAVRFLVRNDDMDDDRSDKWTWVIEVDMRRKDLRSVVPYNEDSTCHQYHRQPRQYFPAKIPYKVHKKTTSVSTLKSLKLEGCKLSGRKRARS